jgi:hypothetical protein
MTPIAILIAYLKEAVDDLRDAAQARQQSAPHAAH